VFLFVVEVIFVIEVIFVQIVAFVFGIEVIVVVVVWCLEDFVVIDLVITCFDY